MAKVSKEEVLHIAKLADLNLEEILNYANVVNSANVEELEITIGSNEKCNAFRKDEVIVFEDTEALLQNAPSKERNMFKIPKVING